jgi:hypothetical protein
MEGSKKGSGENYVHILFLGYAVLAISLVSAAFAYVSSTQNELPFTIAYLGLCICTLVLFIFVRRYALKKIKEQEGSTPDKNVELGATPE